MNQVVAKAIDTGINFKSDIDILELKYEPESLHVSLVTGSDRKTARLVFREVAGFRVLDEGDLLEFWPACSLDNGWVFEIMSGGWFDLELTRSGFLKEKGIGLNEYLVVTQNRCVSVLSDAEPNVEISSI